MELNEQHEMLCAILTKLVPVLDCDELSLLAHHVGISVDEFYYNNKPQEHVEVLEVIKWKEAA